MPEIRSCVVLGCLAIGAVFGQSAAAPVAFSVASVKINAAAPGASRSSTIENDTSVTYTRTTLLRLIMRAYSAKYYQVKGPSLLTSSFYDITARMPEDATKEHIPILLQQLLRSRFGVRIHREIRDTPVYALTATEGPLKFKPCQAEECQREFMAHAQTGPTYLHANTLGALAVQLSAVTDRPVEDFTGVAGTFNITVPEFMPATFEGDDATSESTLPSVFTAIRNLGLKLEARRAPLEYIIVDFADPVPTPN